MSARTHLAVNGRIVCGGVPIAVAYSLPPDKFVQELPNLRCKRCEKSITGEALLRRAQRSAS